MISTLLYIIFFVSCFVLILTFFFQPGKADSGSLFTSNISSTAFGPRRSQSVLSRITITAAAIFMFSALLLSFPAITGNVSVLQSTPEGAMQTTPATVPSTANTTVEPTAVPSVAASANNAADTNANK